MRRLIRKSGITNKEEFLEDLCEIIQSNYLAEVKTYGDDNPNGDTLVEVELIGTTEANNYIKNHSLTQDDLNKLSNEIEKTNDNVVAKTISDIMYTEGPKELYLNDQLIDIKQDQYINSVDFLVDLQLEGSSIKFKIKSKI